MAYRRILTIQDISCIGQCSMTVALPILSACGHEVCILPSAVLSTHTGGFGKPVVAKLTSELDAMRQHWKIQNITFDAVYIGYLGNVEAIHIASQILDEMLAPGGKIIVDPAMADHGKLYSGLDEAYAREMMGLCLRADVMLPNVTEAAMMTGMPYRQQFDSAYILELMNRLGGKNVVLTGAVGEQTRTGIAIRQNGEVAFYEHERIGGSFHGTGDIFASAFVGAWLQDKTLADAVQIAADYTCRCIRATVEAPAHWYGVKFETALAYLISILQ